MRRVFESTPIKEIECYDYYAGLHAGVWRKMQRWRSSIFWGPEKAGPQGIAVTVWIWPLACVKRAPIMAILCYDYYTILLPGV
jgi:hypothetical protein